MKQYRTIKEIVEQLESCKYEANDGHPLEKNIAFERLKVISELNYQPKFQINEKVVYKNDVYFINSILTTTSSHPNCELEYHLSKEYNRESTTNTKECSFIKEKDLVTFEEFELNEIENAKKLLISKGIIKE